MIVRVSNLQEMGAKILCQIRKSTGVLFRKDLIIWQSTSDQELVKGA
jgi:hypothetical protein